MNSTIDEGSLGNGKPRTEHAKSLSHTERLGVDLLAFEIMQDDRINSIPILSWSNE